MVGRSVGEGAAVGVGDAGADVGRMPRSGTRVTCGGRVGTGKL